MLDTLLESEPSPDRPPTGSLPPSHARKHPGAPLRWPRARLALALVLIASVGLPIQGVGALEVDDLYVAQVPVDDKNPMDRDAALARALEEVLVKVTGLADPGSSPAVRAALGRPASYLQEYRYETVTGPGGASDPLPRQVLAVRFDARAVDDLLLSAGLPIWSRTRPSVLIWLAAEIGGARTLVGPADPPALAAAARDAAGRRGLPLLVPLLDLEDRARVAMADVWGGFTERVVDASRRYGAEAILIGRVSPVAGGAHEARWTLLLGDAPQTWRSAGASAEQAVDAGVQAVADRLAAQFAQRDLGSAAVALRVTGIAMLEDYARALAYLGSLDIVTRLAVTGASRDSVSFEVEVRGGLDSLAQVVRLGRTLVAETADLSARTYRLQPGA